MAKIGICYFCGETKTLTKEHFYPKWMIKFHPIDQQIGAINIPKRTASKREVGIKTVDSICHDCNNGWMSQIQDKAKDVIAPLVTSMKWNDRFTQQQANIISTWMTMTTMVYEADDSESRATSVSNVRSFSKTREIPESWRIWIGRYGFPVHRGISHMGYKTIDGKIVSVDDKTRAIDSQATMMLAGKLILFSVSGPICDQFPEKLASAGMMKIWPELDNSNNPPASFYPTRHPGDLADRLFGILRIGRQSAAEIRISARHHLPGFQISRK